VSQTRVLIFSEHPPARGDAPATGLSIRHSLMAELFTARGLEVSYACPRQAGMSPAPRNSPAWMAFDAPADLAGWCKRQRPDIIILGYWELAAWIPEQPGCALVLDYVAPRLLERQFENRERMSEDICRLVPLLARCVEVWVGNQRQADLMLGWMLLAGHDCRRHAPIAVVPIAGRLSGTVGHRTDTPQACSGPLNLLHGGRDWPWRASTRWLEVIRNGSDPRWQLIDASENGSFGTLDDYRCRLQHSDLLLELSDDNLERRFSQSFRVCDALCAGVPVLCNDFLPLAPAIAGAAAGWIVHAPDELPGLLAEIAGDREELERRAAAARALAAAQLDATHVYGGLAERLLLLAQQARRCKKVRPLTELGGAAGRPGGIAVLHRATAEALRDAVHHRLRLPFHAWLGRRLVARPLPGPEGRCWVICSRSDLFPTRHGAAVKIERTAWALSFQVDEVLILTERRDGYWRYRAGVRDWLPLPHWMRLIGWPRAFNRVRLVARGLPKNEAFLYLPLVDRGMHLRLMWLLSRHPVEVVSGEFAAFAHPAVWAARLFGTASLMVEHNVEFRRLADQYGELDAAARSWLKTLEVDLAGACDRVITVSDADREHLLAAGVAQSRLHTIPHGVDLQRFDASPALDLRTRYRLPSEHAVLVYHGIYSYPPNLEAVEELSARILPALAVAGHPASVVAIGPEPPEFELPGVTFTGAVDDLAGHLAGGDLAVIPLRSGGGTRMKILDDFAARVAVVSTAKGMEGIPVEHGAEILVADDPAEMVAQIAALLQDPQRRRGQAERARRWVEALDWREIGRRYVVLMDQVIARRPG